MYGKIKINEYCVMLFSSNMAKVFPMGSAAGYIGAAWSSVQALWSSGSGQHDLEIGTPGDGDILLHKEHKSVGAGWWYVEHVYKYSGDTMITGVVAKDNREDDTGGNPEIISGGLGEKHVTVKVTSKWQGGIDHTVYVFGKKKDLDQDSNMAEVISGAGPALHPVNSAGEAWTTMKDSRQHDLAVGTPEKGDILLHSEQKSGVGSHVYKYRGDNMITAVVAKDNREDDTGGDPEIISGGPGEKHVTVKVTSRSGGGFNHTVSVFGKKQKLKRCNLF